MSTKEKKRNPPPAPPNEGCDEAENIVFVDEGSNLEELQEISLAKGVSLPKKYPLPPDDNVKRNYTGLIDQLRRHKVSYVDGVSILRISNYGKLEHPVWKALYTINTKPGLIKTPGKFILSQLLKRE